MNANLTIRLAAGMLPGKGWNMVFRLYGPLEPWFEKAWRPGDPAVVK